MVGLSIEINEPPIGKIQILWSSRKQSTFSILLIVANTILTMLNSGLETRLKLEGNYCRKVSKYFCRLWRIAFRRLIGWILPMMLFAHPLKNCHEWKQEHGKSLFWSVQSFLAHLLTPSHWIGWLLVHSQWGGRGDLMNEVFLDIYTSRPLRSTGFESRASSLELGKKLPPINLKGVVFSEY